MYIYICIYSYLLGHVLNALGIEGLLQLRLLLGKDAEVTTIYISISLGI